MTYISYLPHIYNGKGDNPFIASKYQEVNS